MSKFGAVAIRCPNGCGVTVAHLTPELIDLLARVNIPHDHRLLTAWCKGCKEFVCVRWVDVQRPTFRRAA